MFGKPNHKDKVEGAPPKKRLRANLADLFLSNTVSAERASSLFKDGEIEDLQEVGAKDSHGKNLSRDLKKKLLRGSRWPKVYTCRLPLWDKKLQQTRLLELPIWLPHEVVAALHAEIKSPRGLCDFEALFPSQQQELERVASILNVEARSLCAVSLWQDGVPYNSDRTKSLEVVSLSILTSPHHQLRIPLMILPKHCMVPKSTESMDAVFQVFKWSFEALATGIWPTARHDGSAFTGKDAWRARQSPQFPQTVLLEVKGDWSAMKSVFRLPGWKDKSGCCWMCNITPQEIHQVESTAPWRQPSNRMDHPRMMTRLYARHHELSPIFGIPFVESGSFKVDWLHCVDLGVSLEFLGGVFAEACSFLPGSATDSCRQLYLLMKDYYKRRGKQSRLDQLKPSMIWKENGKHARLRAKAGESRDLVDFGVELAQDLFQQQSLFHQTILQAALLLQVCYSQLSESTFCRQTLQQSATRFALLYIALSEEAEQSGRRMFKLKPKLHLFLELAYSDIPPSAFWTYRDEDFGGLISRLAERRGGENTARATAAAVFQRFAAQEDLPRL